MGAEITCDGCNKDMTARNNIYCEGCYEDLKNQITELEKQIDQLKDDIKSLEEA